MASVKVVLRKNKKSDGTYPLAIRITKDRKTTYLYLGHCFLESDWDKKNYRVKKSYPNAARLNNMIAKKLSETSDKLIQLETNNTDTSAKAIGKAVKSAKEATFFKQADLYCKQLKEMGKFNRLSADKYRIERFKEFLNKSDINFSEIDVALIKKFRIYLHSTRTVTERTVVNHLVVLRTIFNRAIEAKLVDSKYYPFGKGKVKIKFPESLKIGLNAQEIKALEITNLDPLPHHARNLWLVAYYFAGMRISDVLRLKWFDLQNDRLYYSMGKNEKNVSLKIPARALEIINLYKRENPIHGLIFPDLEKLENLENDYKVQAYIKVRVKINNKHLQTAFDEAKIDKKAAMHKARHSFGEAAGDKIPIQMLQKLYRHTHVSTTIGYQGNFINKETDKALELVLGI